MMIRLLLTVLAVGLTSCDRAAPGPDFEQRATTAALAAHSQEFRKEIIKVTDGVWVAVGYGLANSIMIEGDDGVIIVDTMETFEEGRTVRAAFRRLVDKPVKAIVYTHNHTDHVFGAEAFVDPGSEPQIFAHASLMGYVHRIVSEYRPIITKRSFRMFGNLLDEAGLVNAGIGPHLSIGPDSKFGILAPTRTFDEHLEVNVAGVNMQLVHAPGETNDQIFVWLPEKKVLLPGDNIYKAFPNLYTIRGTPYRPLKPWAASLDKMRALRPEFVIPSHTRPLAGAAHIYATLTLYRDGITYIHDQTVRWINRGLTPDEIVARLRLPPHLAQAPFLQEFYGTAAWSIRTVFDGNLGWFDGNPSSLNPLNPQAQAQRMAELAGGADQLRAQLLKAVEQGQFQWALNLSDHALRLDPDDAAARAARVTALTRLGEAAGNPNARHYYLTTALELQGKVDIKEISNSTDRMLGQLPLENFFQAIAVNLRAEDCLELDQKVGFSFPDVDQSFTVWIRRGVAEIQPRLLKDLDIHMQMDSLVWKKVLAKQRNAAAAIATDMEALQGSRLGFLKFMALFRPD